MHIKRKTILSSSTRAPSEIVSGLLGYVVVKVIFCLTATVVIYFFYAYFVFNFINFCIEYIVLGKAINHTNSYLITVMVITMIIVNYKIISDRTSKR